MSTPNTHQLREIRHSSEQRELIANASLVVPDGMPLIWASRLIGTPLRERVAGSDLVWSLARGAARDGRTLFLLGGDDGVAVRAARVLTDRVPTLRVVGAHCPPIGFEQDPAEMEAIVAALRDAEPDIVYVGLGFPKQEQLILHLRGVLPRAWFLAIGVSLSFISEDQKRAPRWMQCAGLEWIHRLLQEPGRLYRRYLVEGIPFTVALLFRSFAAGRTRKVRGITM